MTADTAPWWFVAIIFAIGVAIVLSPSRVEVQRWRHRRSVQGRLELAELVAGHLTVKLTRDGRFVGDLALAVAQALDELGIEHTAGPPRGRTPRLIVNVPGGTPDEVAGQIREAVERMNRRNARPVTPDLNDGYRS